ncbi:MAG: NADH-quinone oxidoreductase subunit NuoK [Acidibacillus sp.]|uniref:NADH-quinone oxidoreductase subunit K n=1 Tax=Sulfoacidibacillus ferrooxidans TaxID=2005001 RepID=A0A9X2AC20_9BACL|nr:NADH-quinone oxidoreductase subunit NuoK [Sulfoacidibacillus ferrooxidans]MCI0183384.1 NADH-quinone oxidoreductase subunit 11 [Sulfoacidibacillus ferrooxidans]MCY0892294.1 NADH-quinone oxidoreductase subunit NuoK [Acidibacillus sp.]
MALQPFLALAAILFGIGLFGALTKRNLIIVLISIEMMLNAANINLVAFSHFLSKPNIDGQVYALFTIAIAAAEVAVGLAILLSFFRHRETSDVRDMNSMKW